MQYGILPLPHPNSRYQAGLHTLYQAELAAFAASGTVNMVDTGWQQVGGLNLLTFEAGVLTKQDIKSLYRLSCTLALFELLPNELLRPLQGQPDWVIGQDLAGLMKYKGKTNESFTRLMISLARSFSVFATHPQLRLTVLDPLCGRGTTLYCALEHGFNATGIEMDKADVAQIKQMMPRYLQYHRMRYTQKASSLTVQGHKPGDCTQWQIATGQSRKDEDGPCLSVIRGDSRLAHRYSRRKAHLLVTDLPYGVQHNGEGGSKSASALLEGCAPAWKQALLPGGAMVISFNQHTLPYAKAAQILQQAGLAPIETAPFNALSHFVEQAVLRDVIIAQNKGGTQS